MRGQIIKDSRFPQVDVWWGAATDRWHVHPRGVLRKLFPHFHEKGLLPEHAIAVAIELQARIAKALTEGTEL